jgi:hypothetical protein
MLLQFMHHAGHHTNWAGTFQDNWAKVKNCLLADLLKYLALLFN